MTKKQAKDLIAKYINLVSVWNELTEDYEGKLRGSCLYLQDMVYYKNLMDEELTPEEELEKRLEFAHDNLEDYRETYKAIKDNPAFTALLKKRTELKNEDHELRKLCEKLGEANDSLSSELYKYNNTYEYKYEDYTDYKTETTWGAYGDSFLPTTTTKRVKKTRQVKVKRELTKEELQEKTDIESQIKGVEYQIKQAEKRLEQLRTALDSNELKILAHKADKDSDNLEQDAEFYKRRYQRLAYIIKHPTLNEDLEYYNFKRRYESNKEYYIDKRKEFEKINTSLKECASKLSEIESNFRSGNVRKLRKQFPLRKKITREEILEEWYEKESKLGGYYYSAEEAIELQNLRETIDLIKAEFNMIKPDGYNFIYNNDTTQNF